MSEEPSCKVNEEGGWRRQGVVIRSVYRGQEFKAVQSNLMHMCDKSTAAKAGGEHLRSGITCHNCGGVGHYAKSCSSTSKAKSPTTGTTVKVNLAVAKISTKAEYNQHLPETKKQIGKCPDESQKPKWTRNKQNQT